MSSKPLISVIIIFLNEEKFIQEAIESVFAQTYDNWELLLVDDGSADRSTQIALRYAEQYPARVHYLEHDGHRNRGMSASRNLGIRNAKGEYIAFLDADDVWLSNTLEEQVAILESHPEAAMVYGPIQWWYSWTGNPEDIQRDFVEELGMPSNALVQPPTLLIFFLQDKAAVPSGILVRHKAIECIGGFEEAFCGEYEDQAFCAKICLTAPVFASSECWYRYRQHPNSCVSIGHKTGQTYSARRFFLNWLASYVSEQEIKDREVWQILQKELRPFRHPTLYRLSGSARPFGRQMKGLLKLIVRRTLPVPVRRWLRSQWQDAVR